MKKNIIDISLLVIMICVLIIISFDWKYYDEFKYPQNTPVDFNFIARIDSGDYILNTYNDEFRKGLLWDKDTIISYILSKNEKDRIYQLMKEINIIEYPNYFVPKTNLRILPSDIFYFKCTFNNVECEVKWYENTESKQQRATKLRSFLYSIFEKTLKEKQIKNLPESKRYRL